jgi:hypothetical protein
MPGQRLSNNTRTPEEIGLLIHGTDPKRYILPRIPEHKEKEIRKTVQTIARTCSNDSKSPLQ